MDPKRADGARGSQLRTGALLGRLEHVATPDPAAPEQQPPLALRETMTGPDAYPCLGSLRDSVPPRRQESLHRRALRVPMRLAVHVVQLPLCALPLKLRSLRETM